MAPRIVHNELVLLDQVLQQRQNERPIPLKDDDAFELFAHANRFCGIAIFPLRK